MSSTSKHSSKDLPPLDLKGSGRPIPAPPKPQPAARRQKAGSKEPKVPPLEIMVDEVRDLMIGSPIPLEPGQSMDDLMDENIARDAAHCPAIKVDACESKGDKRRLGDELSPDSQHMLCPSPPTVQCSTNSRFVTYYKSNLLPSKSENDIYNTPPCLPNVKRASTFNSSLSPRGLSPGHSLSWSPPKSTMSPTSDVQPQGALCSPLSNRRPIRLVPLNYTPRGTAQLASETESLPHIGHRE